MGVLSEQFHAVSSRLVRRATAPEQVRLATPFRAVYILIFNDRRLVSLLA